MTAGIGTLDLVVNAGGASRRMGEDKALLLLPDGATSLAAHIVNRLAPLVSPVPGGIVRLVGNRAQAQDLRGVRFEVQAVGDAYRDGGALGGLATGLALAQEWAMCVACDMPFVSPVIMQALAARIGASSVPVLGAVPVSAGRLQPFHAIFHRQMAAHLARQLEAGERRVARALEGVRVLYVDADQLGADAELAFTNVNTPAEWAAASRRLAHTTGG